MDKPHYTDLLVHLAYVLEIIEELDDRHEGIMDAEQRGRYLAALAAVNAGEEAIARGE